MFIKGCVNSKQNVPLSFSTLFIITSCCSIIVARYFRKDQANKDEIYSFATFVLPLTLKTPICSDSQSVSNRPSENQGLKTFSTRKSSWTEEVL